MEKTETVRSGLLTTEGTPIPLVGVVVEAQIRDYGARVVISQRYRNDEDVPVEAVYRFPLDEAAAVCGFEALVDGRRVTGRVEEREKAFETYDDALAEGHGAYLLDEERADVFTASVGNLPPGKEVVLRITTVAELPLEGDAIRFTVPTTVAPRYAPEVDQKGIGETEAERVNAPYALRVPYGLKLEADIETSVPVKGVESPSHPVALAVEGQRATVKLSEREAVMDRDFVLKIELAESFAPRALVETGADGATYALVSFRPELETKPAAAEVVFLLDRSGSMQGESIAEARNALQLALRSLRPGCLFNIVGFGYRHQSLFEESRAYDTESLAEASAYVRSLEANMGGTEILPALEAVLSAQPRKGLPRQLFVLTDGEVTNTDAVIALARKHAGTTRVFTFGIGAGASRHLVEGLARAGEGSAEFIAPGERIEAKVMRQLGRALTAALTDVTVEWGALRAEQAPHEAPPVFADGRVVLYGRLEKAEPGVVVLKASSAEGDVAFSVPLNVTGAEEGSLVPTLWARHAIRDLEEGRSALHARRGSRQKRALTLDDDRVKQEIVRLGTTFGLASRHTSFVAVEERQDGDEASEARLRRIPVAVTRGWHGMPEVKRSASLRMTVDMMRTSCPAPAPEPAREAASMDLLACQDVAEEAEIADVSGARTRRSFASEPLMAPSPPVRPLDRLIALQQADGSWTPSTELSKLTGLDPDEVDRLRENAEEFRRAVEVLEETVGRWRPLLDQLEKSMPEVGEPLSFAAPGSDRLAQGSREALDRLHQLALHLKDGPVVMASRDAFGRALATAVALAWLERECADTREEWRLLADKAREWLEKTPSGAAFWMRVAERALAGSLVHARRSR
jgi:Ca-activated chloride channel family protein